MYHAYAKRKQTYAELKEEYGFNAKTLRCYFDRWPLHTGELLQHDAPLALTMDGTFFSRTDGILICRANSRNFYWRYITTEKLEEYARCLDALEAAGNCFSSFTIDGRRGVRQYLENRYNGVPVQFCQFHMRQLVTMRLTKRPKHPANQELASIAAMLSQTTHDHFQKALEVWETQWKPLLQERTENPFGKRKWQYTHRKLRSAFYSMKRNLPWLFTYESYPTLSIPRTTNSCDGYFSHLKRRVRVHQGISQKRRDQLINYLLELTKLS
jgi:hypothetical protein